MPKISRHDHFADIREELSKVNQVQTALVDPTLEYDKYHITPKLVEALRDLVMPPTQRPRLITLDSLLQASGNESYREGQRDMIRMLEALMVTQKEQQ